MNIVIETTACVAADVHTVDDLRELVGHLNKHGVGGDVPVELSTYREQKVYVNLTGESSFMGEWIECGDHVPPGRSHDVLIPMHAHHEPEDAPSRG